MTISLFKTRELGSKYYLSNWLVTNTVESADEIMNFI